jgi:hypothetical protein
LTGTATPSEASALGAAGKGSMLGDVTGAVLVHYRDTDFELVTLITESTTEDRQDLFSNFKVPNYYYMVFS